MTTDTLETARRWVDEADGRTTFLLGAGASKPALPVSAELTAIVLGDIDARMDDWSEDSRVPDLWRGIRPTLTGLGANVEDLYQAIETLTYQDSDPTRHWISGFASIAGYGGDRAELADDSGVVLHLVQRAALRALSSAETAAPLAHFVPLIESPKLGIVTLNYDQLVERAASTFGLSVSTGAELWDGGLRWRFEDGHVPLLKLHGSMNWRASRPLHRDSGNLVPCVGLYEVPGLDDAAPNGLVTPAVIFGSGAKDTPFSVFPTLTRTFHDWLDDSELLVIVGYSFHDPHVDAAIQRWASLASSRRIVVIDPFPRRTLPPVDGGVLGGLMWAMDPEYVPSDWGTESAAKSLGVQRLLFIESTAEDSVPSLLLR